MWNPIDRVPKHFTGRAFGVVRNSVDAAVVAGDAGDVSAGLLFEGGRPGHELEAEAIVDQAKRPEARAKRCR